jgi:hypothetical protein
MQGKELLICLGRKTEKCAGGDLKSIEEICTSTWEPLYRFVYYKVQKPPGTEDITQETYSEPFPICTKAMLKLLGI